MSGNNTSGYGIRLTDHRGYSGFINQPFQTVGDDFVIVNNCNMDEWSIAHHLGS
jgi:hypothetical protein